MATPQPPIRGKTTAKFEHLKGKQILVVDDAFDEVSEDDLDPEKVEEFILEIKKDPELTEALESLIGPSPTNPQEWRQEVVTRLWKALFPGDNWPELPVLKELASLAKAAFFNDKLSKLEEIVPFCDHLRTMGFTVTHFGSSGTPNPGGVGLVMVDYRLGPEGRSSSEVEQDAVEEAAILAAKTTVKRFYENFTNSDERPFLVLMSSKGVSPAMQEDFREFIGLMGGLFDFVRKDKIKEPLEFELKLRTWDYDLPARNKVQTFVTVLSQAATEATKKFCKDLRSLHLQDYVYLQNLSLQQDGEPLGEYLLSLNANYLGDLLCAQEGVQREKQVLNTLEFKRLISSQLTPSTQIAKLYQTSAITPVTGGLNPHPHLLTGEGNESSISPYAKFGDVFVHPDPNKPVLMIINAACDLAYSPHTKRVFDPKMAILLIPGTLCPLTSIFQDTDSPRTEFFERDDKLHRVIWHTGQVETCTYDLLSQTMVDRGYVLTYRLKTPWALAVQQQFAARLTRVGLPVAPPFYTMIDVSGRCEADDGKPTTLTPLIVHGIIVIHRKTETGYAREILFSSDCVRAIRTYLTRVIPFQQKRVDELTSLSGGSNVPQGHQVRLQRAKSKLDGMTGLIEDHDFWVDLTSQTRPWPNDTNDPPHTIVLRKDLVHLYLNKPFADTWQQMPMLALSASAPGWLIPAAAVASTPEPATSAETSTPNV